MSVSFGIDHLLENPPSWKNERIALLTNDAAKTKNGIISRKALIDNGFNVQLLFSPEHGITANAEDGKYIANQIDTVSSLPIISLYGDKFMPSEEDLCNIDILLFDIPDAGTRFYTYLWSMSYWIEAAAIYHKPVYILDRPNPLGGNFSMTEGPYLENEITSFIGRYNIPIKHQCTFGELALYFNSMVIKKANLSIVPCKNWTRSQLFFDWHLPWVNTSPALQSAEACIIYPGLCFFESTNVSVGRGTPYSFEWIGAPWLNIDALQMICHPILIDDIKIEPLALQPDGETQKIKGMRIKVKDPYNYDAVLNGLLLLKMIKDLHPKEFKWQIYPTHANPSGKNHLSLLMGVHNAEELFELPLQDWLQQMGVLLKVEDWRNKMNGLLLYS
jgi:uncharacterized protein YbbC (DUF1343 family)